MPSMKTRKQPHKPQNFDSETCYWIQELDNEGDWNNCLPLKASCSPEQARSTLNTYRGYHPRKQFRLVIQTTTELTK